MEFKRQRRNPELFLSDEWRGWRLASVDEVRNNMETIKKKEILKSWDIVRLLDGWVDGPGYRYNIKNEYKPNMGHMLLVKTNVSKPSDDRFNEEMYSGFELADDKPEEERYSGLELANDNFIDEMYAGVKLEREGMKAALLLSCDDKVTEVMCFVLKSIIKSFTEPNARQAELDLLTESLKETFDQRRTVLHYAVDQPHNEEHARLVAELVLRNFEYGKELIKAADKYGRTALHFAALHGHIHLCSFLMERCGLKADDKDRNSENILHFVVNSNNNDGLERLLEMEEVRSLVASQDAKGKTPLHKAAANGNTYIMETLILEQGQNSEEYIRRPDLFGQTALHEAASRGHQEAVKYLLEKGSKPLLERNSEGKTALHYSVQLADKEAAIRIAQILLDCCRSGEERSLLLWASATGIGTAEQSAEISPEVRSFLKQQSDKEKKAKSSSDLLARLIWSTRRWHGNLSIEVPILVN